MKHTDYMAEFLRDEVNINKTRLETLQRNVDAITSHLSGSDEVGAMYLGYSRQGSWAHGTIIKPQRDTEFDADILLHLDNSDNLGPTELINSVYRGLRESGRYDDKTGRKDRCLRVDYAGEHHVDVVPFVGDIATGGDIANRSTDEWEATNPAAFKVWFNGRNSDTNGELKRVLRLLKYLRDIKQTFSAKSVILTVLVAEHVSTTHDYTDTPTALRDLLGSLADHLDLYPETPPYVLDPSDPGESLNHRWDETTYPNFTEKIRYYADKIAAAHAETDAVESMRLWQEVFPEFGTDPSCLSKQRKSTDEEFLLTKHSIPTQLDPLITCELTCTSDSEEIHTLVAMHRHQKHGLEFAARTNAVGDFDVFWKTKNTGREARSAGDLRGEIVSDGISHRETIKYVGEHWVEVYIVQDGVCVATARRDLKFQKLSR